MYIVIIFILLIILLLFTIYLPYLLSKKNLNNYGFLAIGGRQGFIKK